MPLTTDLLSTWFMAAMARFPKRMNIVVMKRVTYGYCTRPGPDELHAAVTLPRHLDEKVAALHLAKVGAHLSTLRADQADYIGVEQQGPFKSEQYRY